MDKPRLIADIMRARDDWERLINHVGSARSAIGSVSGTWSVKDIVAHILGREQHLADRIAEIARGEPVRLCMTRSSLDEFIGEFGYPDYDSPLLSQAIADDWMVQKYRRVPIEEVIADEIHAFGALLSAVQLLPADALASRDLTSRITHVTADLYRLHGSHIRRRFKRLIRQH